jgi:hypothetical protein
LFLQRGQIFEVALVDTSKQPTLYRLKDLLNDNLPGFYYGEQLEKAPDPNYKVDFFEVEKILAKKTVNKKKMYFVKFLYYPSKFNQWIPETNFKS